MKPLALCLVLAAGALAQQLVPQSLESGGITRTYLLYTPPGIQANRPVPAVLVLHGAGGTGERLAKAVQFHELAVKKGFLVIYPDGFERHWNDGRGLPEWTSHVRNIDDIAFFSALIDRLIARHQADPNRIFVTGISNGGLMTHRVGCELAGKVAAIAPVVRTFTVKMAASCRPSRPVPALMFFGTADRLVPFEGGEQKMGGTSTPVLSARQTIDKWAALDGCTPPPLDQITTNRPGRRVSFSSCKQGAEVVACIREGAGHSWPPDATGLIWDFFEKHPRK